MNFASLKSQAAKFMVTNFVQKNTYEIVPPSNDKGGLYLGNHNSRKDFKELSALKITAVLRIARKLEEDAAEDELVEKEYAKLGIINLYIAADDVSDYNIAQHFQETDKFISSNIQNGNVFVHCIAGASRSVTAIVHYLMLTTKQSFETCYDVVKKKKQFVLINTGFMKQLKESEKEILPQVIDEKPTEKDSKEAQASNLQTHSDSSTQKDISPLQAPKASEQ